MNNLNKLALGAFSLFLTVGVGSCESCNDKSKSGSKPKVELTVDKTELKKNFDSVNKILKDDEVKFTVTVKVTEGEITDEMLGSIKVCGADKFDRKDKTLKEIGLSGKLSKDT